MKFSLEIEFLEKITGYKVKTTDSPHAKTVINFRDARTFTPRAKRKNTRDKLLIKE